ncbi:MAG: SPASM domain-containing protein, partial [Oscillospiraceae bacterium]|nr:SPASM domain-containing protein [Oscillospiraceae bacterium]
ASHDATRGKGNFEKITDGIAKARKIGYCGQLTLRVNLHRKNIGRIPEFLNMFEEHFDVDGEKNRDIDSIAMALLHKTESGGGAFCDYLDSDEYMEYPEIFDMFEDWNGRHTTKITHDFNNSDISCPYNAKAEDVKCGLRIALDGNVFPCQMFTDDKFVVGNVYGQTLAEILNGERLSAFIDAVHSRKGNLEQCKPCGYKVMCAGGCPAAAYIENGTLYSVSARCKSRKQHFNAALLHMLRETSHSAVRS